LTKGSSCPSFPTPDQVEGDVKDTVYQLRESPLRAQMRFRFFDRNDEMKDVCLSVISPDQVEGDIKDTIYQATGIAHAVIPYLAKKSSYPSFLA